MQQQENMFVYKVETGEGNHQIYVTDPSHRILRQVSGLNLEPTNESLVSEWAHDFETNVLIDPENQIRRKSTKQGGSSVSNIEGTIVSSVQVPYGKFDEIVQEYVKEAENYNSKASAIREEAERKIIAELGENPSLEDRLQTFF